MNNDVSHAVKQGLLFNLTVALCMLGGSPLLTVFLFPETRALLVWGMTIHWVLLAAGILVFIYMTHIHFNYLKDLRKKNESADA